MSYYKKTLIILVAFALGIIISFVGVMAVFSKYELLGIALVPIWALTLYGGTNLLPESITLPYDPVGHPALHYIGLTLNSAYITAILIFIFIIIKRKYNKIHECKKTPNK